MRAILDTNIVVSALLFKGEANRLLWAWRRDQFKLFASPDISAEYIQVLSYQKFKVGEDRLAHLMHENLLPYIHPVQEFSGILTHPCRDPGDDKFLRAALGGKAEHLVTGDADLLALRTHYKFKIVTLKEFTTLLLSGKDHY